MNTPFLLSTHLLGVLGIFYVTFFHFSIWTLLLAFVWLALAGVSITGGYHRLFAHRAYACHPAVRLFYLLFGAAGVQNSVLKWASDHRKHHNFVDEEQDPYNIRKGFWWAHMGWILMKEPPPDLSNVPDLAADPLVRFQHRFYLPLVITMGWLLPSLLALLWGDPLGGFLVAGFTRLLVQYHVTFSVNSFAHTLGWQPYSDADSSRDSMVTALLTMGEGYHNYHHRFPLDYRNGVQPWQFDPTKWWVRLLSYVRMTWDLKRTPHDQIVKARLRMEQRLLEAKLVQWPVSPKWAFRLEGVKQQLETALERWQAIRRRFDESKRELGARTRVELKRLKGDLAKARAEFKDAYRAWRLCLLRPEFASSAG